MRRSMIPLVLVLVIVTGFLALAQVPTNAKRSPVPVIYCNDGAPDDIMTLVYLLNNPNIDVKGVVLGNGEIHPKVVAPKFLSLLEDQGHGDIPVVAGFEGALDPKPHEFPMPWRQAADTLWGLVLPAPKGSVSSESGWTFIARTVKETPGTVVLVTGPLTDLALALRSDPSLAQRIEEVVVMGGAVGVPGNIHADWPPESNTVSEWNIWVDPKAAAEVFASGIPLTVVPMDAAGTVFVDRNYLRAIQDSGRRGPAVAAGLYWQILLQDKERALFWDVTAGVAILHPEYYTWVNKEVKVVTKAGPTHGQTVAGKPSNRSRYATAIDADALLKHVFDTMLGRVSTD